MPIYCAACAIPTVSAVLGRDVDKGVADKIRKVNSGAGYGLEIPVHLHTCLYAGKYYIDRMQDHLEN